MAIINIHNKHTTDEGKLKFGGYCHAINDVAALDKELRVELLTKLDLESVDELTVGHGQFHGVGTPKA